MIEARLKMIEDRMLNVESVVGEIREKIFNGFGEQIHEIHSVTHSLAGRFDDIECTQIKCLTRQEVERELVKKYEVKLKLYLSILGLIASFPIWRFLYDFAK